MKKSFMICLFIMMSAFTTLANAEDFLLKKGEELIKLNEDKVKNKDYIKLFTYQSEVSDIVEELKEINFSNPKAIYKLTFSDSTIETALIKFINFEASGKLKDEMKIKMLTGIPNIINAKSSDSFKILAFSLLASSQVFINKDLKKPIIYIYNYGKYSIMNLFIPRNENIVLETSNFIFSEKLYKISSKEEMKNWFKEAIPFFYNCKIENLELIKN